MDQPSGLQPPRDPWPPARVRTCTNAFGAKDVTVLMPYEGSGGEFRVEDPDGHALRVVS
jgi:hypothetical protein